MLSSRIGARRRDLVSNALQEFCRSGQNLQYFEVCLVQVASRSLGKCWPKRNPSVMAATKARSNEIAMIYGDKVRFGGVE